MVPPKPLPYPDCWDSAEEYVSGLLDFATSSELFQILCGGVHILDFFTSEGGLFNKIVPEAWQEYLMRTSSVRLLDVLMRDDLDALPEGDAPPEEFIQYVKNIRKFCLAREVAPVEKPPQITRLVSVGMKPKKIHEVGNFARYVDELSGDVQELTGESITHFVDFGSGQNYLGRALASEPYNKHIVAVEGREINIAGAKELDMIAGLAEREKVVRNKKLWHKMKAIKKAGGAVDAELFKTVSIGIDAPDQAVDFRPRRQLEAIYEPEDGKGSIRYVSGRLESGDLSDVVTQVEATHGETEELRLMAVSIHSCGNLSHHGLRSLILNPKVRAVAIVGCCYNLMTEKLGPPTYKQPFMRPSLRALNGRVKRESDKFDPEGFPMSERLSTYNNDGVRFNITARMMACQAPQNWGEVDSDGFFTRHFFRAVLQKILLDRGVIQKIYLHEEEGADTILNPFNMSTNPVIIGSLSKKCYSSLHAYVRGAITKLTTVSDYHEHCSIIQEKMGNISDEEIAQYEANYLPRKRELSAIWSLMAFSAGVIESLIVTDRWLFLKQHSDLVQDCWVETVFDFTQSPRNLVVVGVKKRNQ